MRAAWYEHTGAASEVLKFGVQPRPGADQGELLIRVACSAVHPADAKRRAGTLGRMGAPKLIPHSDGAGVVVAVGAGVPASEWLGRRIWMYHAQRGRTEGTAAEFIALPARLCRPVQPGYSLREAACIGIPMLTSHAAMLGHGPIAGKNVVVVGGAGSVGRYAVQWARWAGAQRVLATVTDGNQKALALELGASDVLDIHEMAPQAWIEQVLGSPRAVDLVVDIDMGRNAHWVPQVLAPHAAWSIIASSTPVTLDFRALMDANARLRFVQSHNLRPDELQAALEDIDLIHLAGAVRHVISDVLPLEHIAIAHEMVESSNRQGATLLAVSEAE